MWARSRRESPREARIDAVSGVLRVGWRSRVVFTSAGGQALSFAGTLDGAAREVLTACSRTRIVQVSLLVDAAAGTLSGYWIVGTSVARENTLGLVSGV